MTTFWKVKTGLRVHKQIARAQTLTAKCCPKTKLSWCLLHAIFIIGVLDPLVANGLWKLFDDIERTSGKSGDDKENS